MNHSRDIQKNFGTKSELRQIHFWHRRLANCETAHVRPKLIFMPGCRPQCDP